MKPTNKYPSILGVAASSALLLWTANAAVPTCYNLGSLGAAGDGTHTPNVLVYQPGAVAIGPDYTSRYDGNGAHTTVPYNAVLNPPTGKAEP